MTMLRKPNLVFAFLISFLILASNNVLLGQEVLFLLNGETESGVYQGTDGGKILYQPFNSDKVLKIKKKQVAMISNPQGWVRVFQGDNEVLVNFNNDAFDLIITAAGELIRSNEVLVHEKTIEYEKYQELTRERLPLAAVAAVIYKTKQVLPLADVKQVATTLVRMQNAGKFNRLEAESEETVPAITLEAEGTVAQTYTTSPEEESEPNISEETATPRGVEGASGEEADNSEQAEATELFPDILPPSGPVMPVSEEEFQEKALRKTDQFSNYVKRVVDKSASRFEANKAINQAITLFVHDSSYVEVSNVKTSKKSSYFIREYLYHIQELKYDRVEVDWAEVSYVGDIRLGPDGNWYGSVSFLQIFKGFKDGRLLYEDKTLKRMEVILKGYEKVREGKTEVLWDVLLSNIAVEHTS